MSETSEEQEQNETSEDEDTIASTLSWTWQILGMLLGTATAISIIKNGFAIDVYGLPAKVLANYIWFRETLFVPVVWAVRRAPWRHLPTTSGDVLAPVSPWSREIYL